MSKRSWRSQCRNWLVMGGLPPVFLLLATLQLLLQTPPAASQGFQPANSFLIDCGSATNSTVDGRTWEADSSSSPWLSVSQDVVATTSILPSATVPAAPLLRTARIFPSQSSYTFSVTPSRFWIRLYFFPFASEYHNLNSSVFSITANEYGLLAHVNVASVMQRSGSAYLFKEYSVNVTGTELKITFIPSSNSSAFINALEIVSMPADIILDDSSTFTFGPQPLGMVNTALECIYRVNVGGPFVSAANDSTGLFRTWLANESGLYSAAGSTNVSTSIASIAYPDNLPQYFAPPVVYSTALQMVNSGITGNAFNISWHFPIDAEFVYVVRLHFCEVVYTSAGDRIFNVYLQNQTAYKNLDLVYNLHRANIPYFKDYTINSSGGISSLQVDIGPTPNIGTANKNAILNGIEIWKLNNSDGNLAGVISSQPQASGGGRNFMPVVGGLIGGGIALCLVAVLICLCCRRKPKVSKQPSPGWLPLRMHAGNSTSIGSKMSTGSQKSGTGSYASSAPSLGRSFSFADLQQATNNFDEALVLGVGGFGKVYRGDLEDGTAVAVKRGNPSSEQGITEFQTEIVMLSKLRHRHLVSLIGYCDEGSEMILVYECMEKGPLRSHLYGSDLPPLSWRQRLEICIGAARGLHYLHTGASQVIIHRDVKTTNILLDENLVAKVADFGLSKTGPALDRTHVSTAVKGSFGYLDPEYFRRQQLTEKSDVYSFGVVLMEVLCARPAINPTLPRDQVNIAEWAMHYQNMGLLDQIMDPHLVGTVNIESLKKYGETAEKCLAEEGINRPAMGAVLWNLEYALQLQETAMANDLDDDSRNRISELPVRLPEQEHWDVSGDVQGVSLTSIQSVDDSEDATPSAVFSQLVNPQGR